MCWRGGLAGDNATFQKTLVFTKENILSHGVVGVGLSSKSLTVFNYYSFNWIPIGLSLKVTRAEGNRVYTINDKTAYEIYDYYLGDDIAKKLPSVSIDFPLILRRDGHNIARAVISSESDGSLVFGGNVKNGDIVRFGYADSKAILEDSKKDIYKISKLYDLVSVIAILI